MLFLGNKLVSFIFYNGRLYRVFDKYFDKSAEFEVTVPSENGSMNAGIAKVVLSESLGDGQHQIDIDWGDSTSTTYTIDGIESHDLMNHQYVNPGKYIIHIPSSVEKIGLSQKDTASDEKINPSAFTKIIKFGRGLKTLLPYCFRGCSIEEYDFSESLVEDIQDSCIRKSDYVRKVIVGNNIRRIGKNAVSENDHLREIIVPEENCISSVGSYAFSENPELMSIQNIPFSLDQSEKGQLMKSFQLSKQNADCASSIEVEISSKINSIPADMFKGCTRLDYLSIPSTVSAVYSGAFSDEKSMSYDGYAPLVNGLKSLHIKGHQLSDLNNNESNTPLVLKNQDGGTAMMNEVFSSIGSTEDGFIGEKTIAECCHDQKIENLLKNAVIRPDIYVTFDRSNAKQKIKESFFYIKHTPKVSQLDWNRYLKKNDIPDEDDSSIISAESILFKANLLTTRKQIFNDVEEVTRWSCTSAYMDESSILIGADKNGSGVFYTWNPELHPTIVHYSDGTTEEIFHGQTFKSSDLPAGKELSIASIEFGKYMTIEIAPSALTAAENLQHIFIPATVDVIGEKAFSGLEKLETATFENLYGCTFGKESFSRSGIRCISSAYGQTQHQCCGENVAFAVFRDWESEKSFQECQQLSIAAEIKKAKKISATSSLKNTAVEFVSYPDAEEFNGHKAFEGMESLRYVRLPKLSAFNSDYMFSISQKDRDIVLDFTEKKDDVIPSMSDKAFSRSSSEKFENFKIVASRKLYPKWELDCRWSEYSGKLTPINPEWSNGISCQKLSPEFIEDFGLNHDDVVFSMKKTSENSYELNGNDFIRKNSPNDETYRSEKYGEFKLNHEIDEKVNIDDYILLRYVHKNIIPEQFNSYRASSLITHHDQSQTHLIHSGTLTKSIVSQLEKTGNGIKTLYLDDTITEIEDESFMSNNSIESFISGSSLEKIGKRAFKKCENLKSAVFNEQLKSISEEMMSECISLEDISISSTFNGDIGSKAFKGCKSLTAFRIPDGAKEISQEMFKGCISLEDIYIGSSVEWIQSNAFSECRSLSNIHLPRLFKGFKADNEEVCIFKGCTKLSRIFFDEIQQIPRFVPSELDAISLFSDDSIVPEWIEQNDFAVYVPKKLWDRWIFMPQWKCIKDRIKTA